MVGGRSTMFDIYNLKIWGVLPISFSLAAGECMAIEGPSGSGKTLLLRALADLDPVEGDKRLNGHSYLSMTGPQWRQKVCYNAAEPGWWSDTPADSFKNRDKILTQLYDVGLDAQCLDRPISQLSTGERQRLSLLRLLERDPEVLLLDEPTGALDPEATMRVENLLNAVRRTGTSILIVTHDKAQAKRLANRKLLFDQGRVEIIQNP